MGEFGQDKRDTLTRYRRDCDVLTACNGGCPKDRFAASPFGERGQHYLCPSYEAFFLHVREPMQAMSALLRGRAPPVAVVGTVERCLLVSEVPTDAVRELSAAAGSIRAVHVVHTSWLGRGGLKAQLSAQRPPLPSEIASAVNSGPRAYRPRPT